MKVFILLLLLTTPDKPAAVLKVEGAFPTQASCLEAGVAIRKTFEKWPTLVVVGCTEERES